MQPFQDRQSGAMRDTNLLKQRVETAEKHLSASELARASESDALVGMWNQIRDRFSEQEGEIARYRARVETLVQKNDELGRMVDALLASVEGTIKRSRDETVPKITALAEELLASEPESVDPVVEEDTQFAPMEDEDDGFDPAVDYDAPLELETYDEEPEEDDASFGNLVREAAPDLPVEDAPVRGDSLSPGIRGLISRIEGLSKRRSVADPEIEDSPPAAMAVGEDSDLARELQEIESLRNELSGLRERISSEK